MLIISHIATPRYYKTRTDNIRISHAYRPTAEPNQMYSHDMDASSWFIEPAEAYAMFNDVVLCTSMYCVPVHNSQLVFCFWVFARKIAAVRFTFPAMSQYTIFCLSFLLESRQ
jgi:hypothetical protein